MLVNIIPENAPAWVRSPFLRWQLADEVTEAEGELDGIRAWHVCGDLRPGLTRGEWLDAVERLVRDALPDGVVADIAGHFPASKPPHAHILVAARHLDHKCYGAADYGLYDRINTDLRAPWLRWIAG
jgi:hypothetical protein